MRHNFHQFIICIVYIILCGDGAVLASVGCQYRVTDRQQRDRLLITKFIGRLNIGTVVEDT